MSRLIRIGNRRGCSFRQRMSRHHGQVQTPYPVPDSITTIFIWLSPEFGRLSGREDLRRPELASCIKHPPSAHAFGIIPGTAPIGGTHALPGDSFGDLEDLMGREFPLTPRCVPQVHTTHRRIMTAIPAPASIPLLENLRKHEPASMGGQPPVIWHEGDGFHIRDPYGNQWIDFSAGVLVSSMGYGHPGRTAGDQATTRYGTLSYLLFRQSASNRAGRDAREHGTSAAREGVLALDRV